MSTATHVPQTTRFTADQLSADDATAVLRRVGRRRLVADSFTRFRYGDGFSSSRALGFQFVLSFIPLVIAVVGLSSTIHTEKLAQVLQRTLLTLAPGTSGDAVKQALAQGTRSAGAGGRVALVAGALTAVLALTTSMGQIERSANRIYGIQRDRPTARKYGNALVLAFAAGIPSLLGFLLLVAGGTIIESWQQVYGPTDGVGSFLEWARWPLGAALDLVAITVLFRRAPRRRQPAFSWMAFGAVVALALWLLLTGLLALYITRSGSFGEVYGPLTGIVALLLWSQLTSVSLLLGVAFAAQLEAVRAGVPSPSTADPESDGAAMGSVIVLAPEVRGAQV